jgi:hypothetical protein
MEVNTLKRVADTRGEEERLVGNSVLPGEETERFGA